MGLYLHIPFCASICHYCDFAKSANSSKGQIEAYFETLKSHVRAILALGLLGELKGFSSVYFGGGTPSLFQEEIKELLDLMRPLLLENAEITLEANPEHVEQKRLTAWKKAGVNRISLGIQSFSAKGLKALTRTHSEKTALKALDLSLSHFENTNTDLIFAWEGQTLRDLERDLSIVLDRKPAHVSFYGLTYEGNTVLARRYRRGVLEPIKEDEEAKFYHFGREMLKDTYLHEEVSNFARASFEARHNSLYWRDQPYLGLGVGAHGYLFDGCVGLRYEIPYKMQRFLQSGAGPIKKGSLKDSLAAFGGEAEVRDEKDWLLETIWSGLRTARGVDISYLERVSGRRFCPTLKVKAAMAEGCLIKKAHIFYLSPDEWFRESSFALAVFESFRDS